MELSSKSFDVTELAMWESTELQPASIDESERSVDNMEETLNSDSGPEVDAQQVIVGICSMGKKSSSKPMREILTRLEEFEYISTCIFPEDIILKEPIEKWPICDCLISFHSKGFPLEKAQSYAKLRNPYTINNIDMQFNLQDRIAVYTILQREGIELPRFAILNRDSPDPAQRELVEGDDHVEINGIIFNKPFVEKPVSAEDHNIYIYYPTSAGGGSQRLFRKIGSRSSVYSPESRVRKNGSFIYENFMPTDGTDVKVYTVGPDYAHAEARKSPALDGKVERDSEGKEVRYPIILSSAEKLIARKVCIAFLQTVCGFDLLRANGKSYVCDVNGFSFVKNSSKYYDDCAKILGNMILRELAPTFHIPWNIPFQLDDPPIVPTTFGTMMELRCVVAVIRHGDRTPKQKLKMEVRHPKFFELFAKYDGYKDGHVKLKKPKQLQEVLDIARGLLMEIELHRADPEIEEKKGKLEQLKGVLEMYGHFSGINRKVQLKYQPRGWHRRSSSEDGDSPRDPSLVLILKWGGELTPAGRVQAEELGRLFRCMYPGGQERAEWVKEAPSTGGFGECGLTQGLGLLRLHSTYRHDLKIYASDEGRVQMTAAAFAKGLLALEGELTPILVQMVKSANTNGLLDNDGDCYNNYQNMVKNRLHEIFQQSKELAPEDVDLLNPTHSRSIDGALQLIQNPEKMCERIHELIQRLNRFIESKKDEFKKKDISLYSGESWELMQRRWAKLEKDFRTKNKCFDISKIPDIYDCIKYDLEHNLHTIQFGQAEDLYKYSKYLADVVIPQEYGMTKTEKLAIGLGICSPLLRKIRADLQRNIEVDSEEGESINRLNPMYSRGVSSPGRHVRTRLYFSSESHIHSLLTVLRFGGLLDANKDEQWRRAMDYVSDITELNYLSQIVIMLYEDPTKDATSENRFHVELHFSPGVNCFVHKNQPQGPGFRPKSCKEYSELSKDEVKIVSSNERSIIPSRIEEEEDTTFQRPPDDVGRKILRKKKSQEKLKKEKTNDYADKVERVSQREKAKQLFICPSWSSGLPSVDEATDVTKLFIATKADDPSLPNQTKEQRETCTEIVPGLNEGLFEGKRSPNKLQPTTRSLSDSASFKNIPSGTQNATSQVRSYEAENHQKSSFKREKGLYKKIRNASCEDIRRHRHSIHGQMISYLNLLGQTSVPVFSTAVISGSTSAPDLTDNFPPNPYTNLNVNLGGTSIRPLETLHNALSLHQLDKFLEQMTLYQPRCTPLSSPLLPSTPLHHQNSKPSSNCFFPTTSETPPSSHPINSPSESLQEGISPSEENHPLSSENPQQQSPEEGESEGSESGGSHSQTEVSSVIELGDQNTPDVSSSENQN